MIHGLVNFFDNKTMQSDTRSGQPSDLDSKNEDGQLFLALFLHVTLCINVMHIAPAAFILHPKEVMRGRTRVS